jgi:phage terminase large subunit
VRTEAQDPRAVWRADPERFAREALGASLWAKQIEILEAIRDHKRVAVASCHESGKTFVASVAAAWGLIPHRNSMVVSTAPGGRQVEQLLGAEISARYVDLRRTVGGAADADIGVPAPASTSWYIDRESFPKWFWIGFSTSADKDQEHATKFVGFHPADGGLLLLIFDEACGIGPAIWNAAEGIMSGPNVRHLAIGNPTDGTSEFAKCWRDPDWHKITISAFDCPNLQPGAPPGGWGVTREYVDRMARKFGVESAAYQAKVLGQFPTQATDTLIGTGDVQAALRRAPDTTCIHEGHVGIGVDVARFGDAQTVLYAVCWRCNAILEVLERGGQDTMWTAGATLAMAARQRVEKLHASRISIDDTGVGGGVTDRLREQGWNVNAENFGAAPRCEVKDDERFLNRRTELWWRLRDWVQRAAAWLGLAVDVQDQLFADLTAPKYKYRSDGTIVLEGKDDIRKRLRRSPDHGDALALAVAWKASGSGSILAALGRQGGSSAIARRPTAPGARIGDEDRTPGSGPLRVPAKQAYDDLWR